MCQFLSCPLLFDLQYCKGAVKYRFIQIAISLSNGMIIEKTLDTDTLLANLQRLSSLAVYAPCL
jgi:hypothetical protein